MITDEFMIRPRYDEVDQMGYVYHANHISYCHQARTELLRKLGVHDAVIEDMGFMIPVISFNIKYKVPARYDEQLTIKTSIKAIPKLRFEFSFEIYNEAKKLVSTSVSEVVFVDKETRQPMAVPVFVKDILEKEFQKVAVC